VELGVRINWKIKCRAFTIAKIWVSFKFIFRLGNITFLFEERFLQIFLPIYLVDQVVNQNVVQENYEYFIVFYLVDQNVAHNYHVDQNLFINYFFVDQEKLQTFYLVDQSFIQWKIGVDKTSTRQNLGNHLLTKMYQVWVIFYKNSMKNMRRPMKKKMWFRIMYFGYHLSRNVGSSCEFLILLTDWELNEKSTLWIQKTEPVNIRNLKIWENTSGNENWSI